ncbi:MAG: EamA family transporter [Oscillospiraceae bacterium]|nr:EamA family transporter [Oscillospiraceae bacterium]
MKKSSLIYIILAGMLWGTSGLYVHFLTPYGLTSIQMTTVRGVVSAFFIVLYALLFNRKLFKINLKDGIFCFFRGLAMYLAAAFYYLAMQKTSVSTAVVLMYIAPIFVMAFSVAFLGEKLTVIKGISVIAVVVGCGFVSGIIGGLKFSVSGILLGILAGLLYGSYSIITKIQMKKNINPMTASMYGFVFMAVISCFVAQPVAIANIGVANPVSILLMLGCGLCTCVLPYTLYTISLKDLPAGTASSLAIIEPLAATIYSIAFLGERPDMFSYLGIAMILGAVLSLSKSKE